MLSYCQVWYPCIFSSVMVEPNLLDYGSSLPVGGCSQPTATRQSGCSWHGSCVRRPCVLSPGCSLHLGWPCGYNRNYRGVTEERPTHPCADSAVWFLGADDNFDWATATGTWLIDIFAPWSVPVLC
jgi:hypothetical protein